MTPITRTVRQLATLSDPERHAIFGLARDPFGVKPFYYFHDGTQLAFASEAKALLEVPGISADIDFQSLHQYLTFLWVPEPRTIFRSIHKLPAGGDNQISSRMKPVPAAAAINVSGLLRAHNVMNTGIT